MPQRTTEARNRDRADLLALLAEADAPVRLDTLACTVHGLNPQTTPGYRWTAALRWTSTDLAALTRAGKVTGRTWPGLSTAGAHFYADSRYELTQPGTLTREEETADMADVRRQIASWEPAE